MGVGGIDGNLAGSIQVPSYERNGPQLLSGENAKLKGQPGKDHRRIHVGRVVGGVDGHRMPAQVLRSMDGEFRP